MGVPPSSISIGFSLINHPFWGTTILGNPHNIYVYIICIYLFICLCIIFISIFIILYYNIYICVYPPLHVCDWPEWRQAMKVP